MIFATASPPTQDMSEEARSDAGKKPSSASAREVQQRPIEDLEPPSLPSSNESLSLRGVSIA